MKIRNITNPKGMFEVLEQCKGEIKLVTADGDMLNLKSKLCQFVLMANIMSEAKIDEAELLFSEPDDAGLLLDFLICG